MRALRRAFAEAARECYYRTLGVARDASADEVRRSFLRLAKELHPDVAPDPRSAEQFRRVSEAYTILSNSALRAQYNRAMRYEETSPREDGGVQFENDAEYARQARRAEEQRAYHADLEQYLRFKYDHLRVSDPRDAFTFDMSMYEKKVESERAAEAKYRRVETSQGVFYYDKAAPRWWERVPYSLRVLCLFLPMVFVVRAAHKALEVDAAGLEEPEDAFEAVAGKYKGYIAKVVPGTSL